MALSTKRVAIIGGGPAGLMAAEVLSQQGIQIDLFDAMPSVGRKFLQQNSDVKKPPVVGG